MRTAVNEFYKRADASSLAPRARYIRSSLGFLPRPFFFFLPPRRGNISTVSSGGRCIFMRGAAGRKIRKTNGTDWFPAMARNIGVDEVAAAKEGRSPGLSQEAGNARSR